MCLAAFSYLFAAPATPTFTKSTTDFIGNYRTNIAVGDYNNDGYLDIFYIGENTAGGLYTACLYKNNGDGTFTQQDINIPGMTFVSAAWIDYDNDGNLDLIVCGSTTGDTSGAFTRLYHNTGAAGGYTFEEATTAQFEQIVNEGNDYPFNYVTVGDYDNDGLPDILISGVQNVPNGQPDYRRVDLYKNNGDGTFTLQTTPQDGIQPFTPADGGTIQFADINNDGYLDIIVTGYADATRGTFYLYLNNGDGTFTDYTPSNIPGAYQGGAISADFDNDGKMDLVVNGINYINSDWPRYATLAFGAGDGSVTVPDNNGNLEPFNGGFCTAGDLNNDGLTDLIANGWGSFSGGATWMYLNNGDKTFQQFTNNPFQNARAGGNMVADFNNDGLLDVLFNGYSDARGASAVDLWFNQGGEGIKVNTPPTAPANLKAQVTKNQVSFTWDASTDVETPAKGLHYNLYIQKEGGTPICVLPADINTGFVKVAEQTGAIITPAYVMNNLPDGDYTWGVQAIDNGKMSSKFATGTFTVGGSGIKSVTDNSIIINGSHGVLRVNTNGAAASVCIMDVSGKIIENLTTNGDVLIQNGFEKGIYIVKVNTANGEKIGKVILY